MRITRKKPSCDECRIRKKGCVVIGDSPVCLVCRLNDLDCVFSDRAVPRPRKRSREDANEVTGAGSSNGSGGGAGNKRHHDEVGRYSTPVDDYANLRGHSLLKKTLSLQFPRCSYFVGETGVNDPALLDLGPYDRLDQARLAGDVWLRKTAPGVLFTLQTDPTRQEAIRVCDEIERIVEPKGRSLVDLYFRYVHPCFPVLQRKVFYEKYSRTHREFSPAMLAAVYFLAIKWWAYDPELAPVAAPSPRITQALYDLGIGAFFAGCGQPRLSLIQAGLLLVQCVPNAPRNLAITSVITSMGLRLGLGLNCSSWKVPKWERGLRKRITWGIYIQDKWMSLLESVPSMVDERSWALTRLHADDFSDEFEDDDNAGNGIGLPTTSSPAAALSPTQLSSNLGGPGVPAAVVAPHLYSELCALSQIVAEICDRLFSQTALATLHDTEKILDTAKPIQIRLRTWYSKLPPELRVSPGIASSHSPAATGSAGSGTPTMGPTSAPASTASTTGLNSNGYLHLAYLAAEITLHRRIIKSLRPDSPATLVEVCRQAAQARLSAAVEFVRSLRPDHIAGFWHFSAANNFALIGVFAALLYLTSHSEQEALSYKAQLHEYLWTLRVHSHATPHFAHALQVLLVAISRVPGLTGDTTSEAYSP